MAARSVFVNASAPGVEAERPDDWRDIAACRTEDPELFFPVGVTGPAAIQAEQAKAVCRRCLVADECLRAALADPHTAGVWGGTTEAERAELVGGRPVQRNVLKTHCPYDHPYDDDNTGYGSKGERVCLTCKTRRMRELNDRRREERQAARAVAS